MCGSVKSAVWFCVFCRVVRVCAVCGPNYVMQVCHSSGWAKLCHASMSFKCVWVMGIKYMFAFCFVWLWRLVLFRLVVSLPEASMNSTGDRPAWPVVKWGPRWLHDKTEHLIDSLPLHVIMCLSGFLGCFSELRWGSSCSGTESPAWSLLAFGHAMGRFGAVPTFDTIFSAELEQEKREFIERCSPIPTKQMFSDMEALTRAEAALELRSNTYQMPNLHRIFVFAAGFSCKSVSGLATGTPGGSDCLESGEGTTAETFTATKKIISVGKFPLIILENVLGLKRQNQHLRVMRDLVELGYVCEWFECLSSMFSLPHERWRIWFVAIRKDRLSAAGWSLERWRTHIREHYHRLGHFRAHAMTPMAEFLLSEDDNEVERANASAIARFSSGEISGSTGPGCAPMAGSVSKALKAQVESACGVRSLWGPHLERCYPQWLLLSEREKTLLDPINMGFPDVRFLFV